MKINVKETKNFFNETIDDAKQISIQCNEVLKSYRQTAWGSFATTQQINSSEETATRHANVIEEFRQNIPIVKAKFDQLCQDYKAKTVNAEDFNWKTIEYTQEIMSYVEYLGATVLPDLYNLLTLKETSYREPIGVQPPTEVNTNITIH